MPDKPGPYALESTFVRLSADSNIEPLMVNENFWPNIVSGKLGDWKNEYLVGTYSFEKDWPTWEQHPKGDEFIYLLFGALDFVLESNGQEKVIELRDSGSFIIVPKGTWHTARVKSPAKMLAVTAGAGTQIRPVAT